MYCFKNNIEFTRDSEISLYDKRNNDIDLIRLYMNDISEYRILSQEEEFELSRLSKLGDVDARNKLVEHNLRLVVSIAKNYINCGIDFGDLIQYGNEGLMTSVDRFDEEKGYRFTTYATYWIRQAITRGIAFSSRNIRVPYGVHENSIKIRKIINMYIIANNGRIPSDLELSEITGLSLDNVRDARECMDMCISLFTPTGREEKDSTLGEILPNDEESLEERFDNYYMSEYLDKLLDIASLNEREIFVLKARNGFFGKIYTLEEIGKHYGITREGVRQIEKHGLEKLRTAVNVKRTYEIFHGFSKEKSTESYVFRYVI
jgi:RNA polymerase primary sigma factor